MSPESEFAPNIPSRFQQEIVYSDPHYKASAIAEGTSNIFSLYFNHGIPHFDVAKRYLTDYTLPFIDSVRAGFAKHPERVDKIGIGSSEDILRVMEVDRESVLPYDETLEALDLSLITMGIMHDMVVQRVVDYDGNIHTVEFSRRGMLQPPETLDQTRERIHELWVETFKIAQQITSPSVQFFENPSVMRTTLFFEVCKSLPLRNVKDQLKDEEMKILEALARKFQNPLDR